MAAFTSDELKLEVMTAAAKVRTRLEGDNVNDVGGLEIMTQEVTTVGLLQFLLSRKAKHLYAQTMFVPTGMLIILGDAKDGKLHLSITEQDRDDLQLAGPGTKRDLIAVDPVGDRPPTKNVLGENDMNPSELRYRKDPDKHFRLSKSSMRRLKELVDEKSDWPKLPPKGDDRRKDELTRRIAVDNDIIKYKRRLVKFAETGVLLTPEERELLPTEVLDAMAKEYFLAQARVANALSRVLIKKITANHFGSQHLQKQAPMSISDPQTELIGAMQSKLEAMESGGFDVYGSNDKQGRMAVRSFVEWLYSLLHPHHKLFAKVFDQYNPRSLFTLLSGGDAEELARFKTVPDVIGATGTILQRFLAAGAPERLAEVNARLTLKDLGRTDHDTVKLANDMNPDVLTAARVCSTRGDKPGAIKLLLGGVEHEGQDVAAMDTQPTKLSKEYVIGHLQLPHKFKGNRKAEQCLARARGGEYPYLMRFDLDEEVKLGEWCDLTDPAERAEWCRAYITIKRAVNPPKRTGAAAVDLEDEDLDAVEGTSWAVDTKPTSRDSRKRGGKKVKQAKKAKAAKALKAARALVAAADLQGVDKRKTDNSKPGRKKKRKPKQDPTIAKLEGQLKGMAMAVASITKTGSDGGDGDWMKDFPTDMQALCDESGGSGKKRKATAEDGAKAIAALDKLGLKVAAIESDEAKVEPMVSAHDIVNSTPKVMFGLRLLTAALVVAAVVTVWGLVGAPAAIVTGACVLSTSNVKMPSYDYITIACVVTIVAASLALICRGTTAGVAQPAHSVVSLAVLQTGHLPPFSTTSVVVGTMAYNMTISASTTYVIAGEKELVGAWTAAREVVRGDQLLDGTLEISLINLSNESIEIDAGTHVANLLLPPAGEEKAAPLEHTYSIAESFVALVAPNTGREVFDLRHMSRLDGPTLEQRAYAYFYDANCNILGKCLMDSGSSSAMFIRKEAVSSMNKNGSTWYVHLYDEQKINEHKITTYDKGSSQPRIVGQWGGTVVFHVKAPGSETGEFKEVFVNAFVIEGTAPGPDLLGGCRFMGAHGIIVKPNMSMGTVTNEVMCRYTILTDDSLPTAVLNEIAKPGSQHVKIFSGKRDMLASAVQRQVSREERAGVAPASNGAAAMDLEVAEEVGPTRRMDAQLVYTVQHLYDQCGGSIPQVVKTLATMNNIEVATAQEQVSWAVKNGVVLDGM